MVSGTQDKLLEAKYFLQQMKQNRDKRNEFRWNLSAFLTAARSITLMMQAEYSNKVEGFDEWYNRKQKEMKDVRNIA
jgi:hypothetical protein